jgi:transcriptional regulator with XRE-family HTH domain
VAPLPITGHNFQVRDVKRIRKARGLSQVDLAEMVGVTQGLISKIERGDANPTLDVILRLANALQVSPALLFGGLPDRHQRLIDSFEALDPEMQDHAEALLDRLSGPKSRP